MLTPVGKIPGDPEIIVYKGVFNFFETHGVPIDIIFEHFKKNNYMVSWVDFYREARAAGVSHDRIFSRLEEAVTDVWGPKFYCIVKEKLESIFSNPKREKFEPIKPDKIIIINDPPQVSTVPMQISPTLPMEVVGDVTQPMPVPTITLYRPTGGVEHELVRQSGYKRFPPRLAHQPIFYPVASEEYAIKIARDWNANDPDSGNVGYVLKFEIRKDYIASYNIHIVGSSFHREYWIPAEHMEKFNSNIIGQIQVVHVFRALKRKT